MTGAAWSFAGAATAGAVLWLALYRLPLSRPRTRQRFRLAVASVTGLPARLVFPVVGTAIYLLTGGLAVAAVTWWGGVPLGDALAWPATGRGVATVLLVALGTSAATGFAMSVLYAVRPRVDVPGAVAGVGWIREVLALPRRWRWLVPMAGAGVEELFFRGVFLVGLLAHGAPVWAAVGLSGAVFVAGQVALTERALAALVLGVSSVVLSVLCGLLVVVAGSVLPALVVHASFAGYYTNLGGRGADGR
jgi:hypothetical protein